MEFQKLSNAGRMPFVQEPQIVQYKLPQRMNSQHQIVKLGEA